MKLAGISVAVLVVLLMAGCSPATQTTSQNEPVLQATQADAEKFANGTADAIEMSYSDYTNVAASISENMSIVLKDYITTYEKYSLVAEIDPYDTTYCARIKQNFEDASNYYKEFAALKPPKDEAALVALHEKTEIVDRYIYKSVEEAYKECVAKTLTKKSEHKRNAATFLNLAISEATEYNEEREQQSSTSQNQKFLNGYGQKATEKFYLSKGLALFEITYKGSGHFSIWLLDEEGNKIELLVNEIGKFDGSKAVRIDNSGYYLLDVSADGAWSVQIS